MSTKEIAYNIFNQLNEKQLEGFIRMFGDFFPKSADNKKLEAFQKLDDMIEEVPEVDYDKELAEYREEKYGQ